MRSLKEYAQELEEKENGGLPKSADFHSKGYHRFFEGWSEYKETDAKGKVKIRRVYTGIYHHPELTEGKRGWIRRTYLLLYILMILLFAYASTRVVYSNSVFPTAVSEAVAFVGCLWLIYTLVSYWMTRKDFTVYEFEQSLSMKKASLITACSFLAAAVISLVYMIAGHRENPPQELITVGSFLLAAAAAYAIRGIENRIAYTQYLSKETPPSDANQMEA